MKKILLLFLSAPLWSVSFGQGKTVDGFYTTSRQIVSACSSEAESLVLFQSTNQPLENGAFWYWFGCLRGPSSPLYNRGSAAPLNLCCRGALFAKIPKSRRQPGIAHRFIRTCQRELGITWQDPDTKLLQPFLQPEVSFPMVGEPIVC